MSEPQNITLPAALAAYDAGLCVVRARADGTKAPAGTWEQYQTARPTRHQVEQWFSGGHPGIGIVCGAVSGDIEMFELEGRFVDTHKDDFIEACRQAGLELLLRRLANGYHWGSPSGGRNFLYRVTGCPVDGNTKLAKNTNNETLIETRGEGGFVILPPSHGPVHPTGAPWILRGGSFAEIPTVTAEERAALFDIARSFDTAPSAQPVTVSPVRTHQSTPWTGGQIGESWMDAVTDHVAAAQPLRQLLEQYGWTYCYTDRHGRHLMRRPGKTEGVSASINTSGRLHVFSTSTPFQAGQRQATTYDHLDVIAAYEHRGDRQAAARHIAEQTGILTAWQTARNNLRFDPPNDVDPDTGEIVRDWRNLPDSFWTARPQLEHIRQAAHSRARSADAVLLFVLARISTLVHPAITLPPIVGSAASLNLLGAVVASSGAGKTTSGAVARELVPLDDKKGVVADKPMGSGEGLVEMFFEWVPEEQADGKTKKVKRQTKNAAYVYLDEGQALAEMGNRKGATLLPTLRSAWSGDTLGQSNATQETHRVLPAHSYRLAIMVGFQVDYAAPLIDDAPGGTPQRFIFCTATDPNIPIDNPPDWPGPLPFTPPTVTLSNPHIDVDPTVADAVRRRNVLTAAGIHTPAPLDSHIDLVTLKAAALLAILDRRLDISSDDWALAEQIMRSSHAVRHWIVEHAQQKAARSEAAYAAKLAQRAAVIETSAEQRALEVGARAIARRVHGAEEEVVKRELTLSVTGKHRKLVSVDEMIAEAESKGWIERVEGGWIPGESRPT